MRCYVCGQEITSAGCACYRKAMGYYPEYPIQLNIPQGWQCPVCKRVYSPTTPLCYYCTSGVKVQDGTGGGDG